MPETSDLLEKSALIFLYNFHREHSWLKSIIKELSPKINVKNIKNRVKIENLWRFLNQCRKISCEDMVPILHIFKNWVPILHIWEKSNKSFADDKNTYQFLTVKMRKMWNLCTDVRPPKLSKLTIRKFNTFQKWRFGTLYQFFTRCEICEMWNLRINKAPS